MSEYIQNIRQSHKLHQKSHKKNWKVELTAEGQTLAEVKIQRGIFQEDALSPLLFLVAMMPLNYLLRKCTGGNKFTKAQEKINHVI